LLNHTTEKVDLQEKYTPQGKDTQYAKK